MSIDVTKAVGGALAAVSPTGISVTKVLVSAVLSDERIIITPCPLANGTKDVPYSTVLEDSLGSGTWTIIDGALPPGLTLHTDGTIDGTPSARGTYVFTVKSA